MKGTTQSIEGRLRISDEVIEKLSTVAALLVDGVADIEGVAVSRGEATGGHRVGLRSYMGALKQYLLDDSNFAEASATDHCVHVRLTSLGSSDLQQISTQVIEAVTESLKTGLGVPPARVDVVIVNR